MLVTSEYRHGTIRPTFLFNPRRSSVIGAKLAAGLLAGIVFGILGEGLGFAIGYACLAGRGITYALNTGQTTLLVLGTLAGVALWGALGVGLGTIVRNQVGAIIGLLAWGFIVENLLFGFVPSVGRFAPAHAGDAFTGLTSKHSSPPQQAAPSAHLTIASHSSPPPSPHAETLRSVTADDTARKPACAHISAAGR